MNTVCLYPEPGVHRVQDTGSQLYIEAGSLHIGGCATVLRILPRAAHPFINSIWAAC